MANRRRIVKPALPAGVFEETFSGGALDPLKWNISNGGAPGNNATNTGTFIPANVDMSKGMLCLKMNQFALGGGQYSSVGAEISSVQSFSYGTYEIVARAASASNTPYGTTSGLVTGGITGIFTYATRSYNEIDFEIEANPGRDSSWEMTAWVIDNIYHEGTTTGTTSATPVAHVAGDILLVSAFNSASDTLPTVPGGWTVLTSNGSNGCALVTAWKRCVAPGTSSDTWTNATGVNVSVYRGVHGITPTGSTAVSTGTSATVTYSGLTLQHIDNYPTPTVVCVAGHKSTSAALGTTPAGLVLRANNGTTGRVATFDSGYMVDAHWPAKNAAVTVSDGWQSASIELHPNVPDHTTYPVPNPRSGFTNLKWVWEPGRIRHYIDGVQVSDFSRTITTIDAPMFFNHWGTNSTGFGGMATPGTERYMYVSYFRYTPL